MTEFLKPDDVHVLEQLAASEQSETIQKRALLLLAYEAGKKTADIAEEVELSPGRVLYWRRRYLKEGLAAFGDAHLGVEEESDEEGETKPLSLAKLTKAARKAKKGGGRKRARKALAGGIKAAEKRRRTLKKNARRASKKKTSKIKDRLKKLNGRIKKAKRTLRKM